MDFDLDDFSDSEIDRIRTTTADKLFPGEIITESLEPEELDTSLTVSIDDKSECADPKSIPMSDFKEICTDQHDSSKGSLTDNADDTNEGDGKSDDDTESVDSIYEYEHSDNESAKPTIDTTNPKQNVDLAKV